MPTKYQRLSVVKDPEVERALAIAQADPELASLSEAGRLSALAVKGAEALLRSDALSDAERALLSMGATLPTGDLIETSQRILKRWTPPSRVEETPTESLEWVRGDR